MRFVCPACKGPLEESAESFSCPACRRQFPVILGIPDFRVSPDPYIGIQEDREKGVRLDAEAGRRGFEALVRHYYAITPDHPADLVPRRIRHALAEVDLSRFLLRDAHVLPQSPGAPRAVALLDIGCSTGALLIAASEAVDTLVGVDVAFRWLAIGRTRLREAGVSATLVCANAEALPFPDRAFHVVTASDLIEHVTDAASTVREAHRVLTRGGTTVWTTNNRHAPVREPHVGLWGVGNLPRRWQRRYVALRRPDLRPYHVSLRGAGELARLFRSGGFDEAVVEAAALIAPDSSPSLSSLLGAYNRVRRLAGMRSVARLIGPRLLVRATKSSVA